MSARRLAAASCFSIMSIVNNSRRLATCAHPASPTCSLPSWAIRPVWHKEQLDDYSIKRSAGRSPRLAGNRTPCHVADTALLLVGAPRIVGEPFDLYRAVGGGGRQLARLLDRHAWPRVVDAQPHALAHDTRRTLPLRHCPDHGYCFCGRAVLLPRRAAQRAPRSQHLVLEVAAGFRSYHRVLEGKHSIRRSAVACLRHHRCHALHHAVVEHSRVAGEWPERRYAMGAGVDLPGATALSPGDRACAVVCTALRLDVARIGLGAARRISVGRLAAAGHLHRREACL